MIVNITGKSTAEAIKGIAYGNAGKASTSTYKYAVGVFLPTETVTLEPQPTELGYYFCNTLEEVAAVVKQWGVSGSNRMVIYTGTFQG
jgi:hypothetical protein